MAKAALVLRQTTIPTGMAIRERTAALAFAIAAAVATAVTPTDTPLPAIPITQMSGQRGKRGLSRRRR